MDKPPIRRLTLADLAILVAVSAVGMLIFRTVQQAGGLGMGITQPVNPPWSFTIGLEVSPFVLPTVVGLLIARLLKPRPTWRRIFRQPGFVACLAILVNLMDTILLRFEYYLSVRFMGFQPFVLELQYALMSMVWSGKEVAFAWTILALARAWRPEPGWIDRAGRALGILAIGFWLASLLCL